MTVVLPHQFWYRQRHPAPPNMYRHSYVTSSGVLGRVNIQDFYTGDDWAAIVTCKQQYSQIYVPDIRFI